MRGLQLRRFSNEPLKVSEGARKENGMGKGKGRGRGMGKGKGKGNGKGKGKGRRRERNGRDEFTCEKIEAM